MSKVTEIPTIDVSLVTIKYNDLEYGLDTANKIKVKPEIETQKATKLIVKGVLLAQKRATNTLTGHTITLSDNVFIPEVVKILQGGDVKYLYSTFAGNGAGQLQIGAKTPIPTSIAFKFDPAASTDSTFGIVVTGNDIVVNLAGSGTTHMVTSTIDEVYQALIENSQVMNLIYVNKLGTDFTVTMGATQKTNLSNKISGYTPPAAGQKLDLPIFELTAYSAINDASGLITGYEKITYPNCTGEPIELDSEDNKFRAPEYTIDSAPDIGQPPYNIEYVDELPVVA